MEIARASHQGDSVGEPAIAFRSYKHIYWFKLETELTELHEFKANLSYMRPWPVLT